MLLNIGHAEKVARCLNSLKKYSGKRVVLFWSGGFDSTCLLLGLLRVGAIIKTVEVDQCNYDERRPEAFHRKKLLTLLKEKYSAVDWVDHCIKVDGIVRNKYLRSAQASIWLHLAPLVVDNETDYLLFGYIVGDMPVALESTYQKIWQVNKLTCTIDVRLPKMEFPFRERFKTDIACLCDDENPTLNEHIWSCVMPIYVLGDYFLNCGECPSCIAKRIQGLEKYGASNDVISKYNTFDEFNTAYNSQFKLHYAIIHDSTVAYIESPLGHAILGPVQPKLIDYVAGVSEETLPWGTYFKENSEVFNKNGMPITIG